MEISEVQVETTLDLAQAVSYLEEIVAGLKSGRLSIEHEGDALLLSPQRTVTVEVKARQKKDKETVGIKLTWQIPQQPRNQQPALRISSKVNGEGQ